LSAEKKKASDLFKSEAFLDRDAEIRTRGLTHPKGARYQAAPHPEIDCKYRRKFFIGQPRYRLDESVER
jgi:hypothetical protein